MDNRGVERWAGPDPDALRLARFGQVATGLALLSDQQLQAVVTQAPLLGTGIGGTAVRLDWHGTPVFVKRVPQSDLERRPEHRHSTANLFGLPAYCQYGVGSPGFSTWRELAAHLTSTNWVLTGECASFPLLYHWRVLERPPPVPTPAQQAERERTVAYWHGSAAVRNRLVAQAEASAELVLFLEHFPYDLAGWLALQSDPAAIEAAGKMVERGLLPTVSFMGDRDLWHFDAHFANILTDGHRLYLSDFGLATSPRFDLTADERELLRANAGHDACYAATHLVNWLVMTLTGASDWMRRNELITRYAGGERPAVESVWAAATITRYAPVAAVMNDFYRKLHTQSRRTPYPASALRLGRDVAGVPGH